jgi:hypothetical protein
MGHSRFTKEEIASLGRAIYEQNLRHVEILERQRTY